LGQSLIMHIQNTCILMDLSFQDIWYLPSRNESNCFIIWNWIRIFFQKYMYYQRHGWNIWYNEHYMSKSISHAISTLDLYHPSGRWPFGWYRVLRLIQRVIQILGNLIHCTSVFYRIPYFYICIFAHILDLLYCYLWINIIFEYHFS
jgi:hypothetical protein